MKSLTDSIQFIKGIGPKRAKVFQKAGVNTIEDLLYFFPRRYEDRRNVLPIAKLKEGDTAVLKAKILVKRNKQSWRRGGFSVLELLVGDDTAKLSVVWFNQSYLKDYFKVGTSVILYGKIRRRDLYLQMVSPEFEIIDADDNDEAPDMGRIVPVYPAIENISQRYLRRLMSAVLKESLPNIKDLLPFDMRQRQNLLNLAKSLIEIHFPQDLDLQKEAHRRLSFEEFFLFIIPIVMRKSQKSQNPGLVHDTGKDLVKKFQASLPFKLTAAQERVIEEIRQDMAKPFAMQRLIQGDVGSGKTIVATLAAIIAVQSGYQVAFMAPTEILAKQHYEKIRSQISEVRGRKEEAKIALLVSSLDKKEKEKTYQEIKNGKIDLVIGTHALLEETVKFKNLGLVIIDEQHKFGVAQRAILPQKGNNPDVLIMTATPIPRTLAITLYGDLDVSVIDQLPPGRKPVVTRWIKKNKRKEVYQFIREKVKEGRQAYIVYPLINESFALDLQAAEDMYKELKKKEFKDLRLGLVHGQIKQESQDKTMSDFKGGLIDVLISTTVLEVGIDVPNAVVMAIEHAERFGLSQLHQLRGRIGRGSEESFCMLISDAQGQEAKARLEIMTETNDGFRIAEEDLKLRGPGEFFGDRQHGLSELKIANPLTQMQLLRLARNEAIKIIQRDPYLESRQNQGIKEALKKRFPGYEDKMMVG